MANRNKNGTEYTRNKIRGSRRSGSFAVRTLQSLRVLKPQPKEEVKS